jgi:heme oxygenase
MATLKEQTHEKHKEAETQPFIKEIFQKKVSTHKYAEYLYQLYLIYHAMENIAGPKLGAYEGIPGLYRSKAIFEDFQELAVPDKTYTIKESTLKYIQYIMDITEHNDLLAHMYVRYLGDLNGGQIFAKLIPGSGTMFQFENKEELTNNFRAKLNDNMGLEACVAFDFNIAIVKEFN